MEPNPAPEAHGPPRTPARAAVNLEAISAHVEAHVGPIVTDWHEIASDFVHIDVLHVPPDSQRRHHTFVTSGVSDLPMAVPPGQDICRRVELMVSLPEDWPLDKASLKLERYWWPIRVLKSFGRLPHAASTWIGLGHTYAESENPEPFPGTGFTAVMLAPPYGMQPGFYRLPIGDGEEIYFYRLVPLYPEELALKQRLGTAALAGLLDEADAWEVVNPQRPNAALMTDR